MILYVPAFSYVHSFISLTRPLGLLYFQKSDALSGQLSSLEFQYSNPTPNFNRLTVKGLVAELIDLSKENADAATALEVCASGKLYNVSCSRKM